jgi:hypothetical protein
MSTPKSRRRQGLGLGGDAFGHDQSADFPRQGGQGLDDFPGDEGLVEVGAQARR